MRGPVAGSVLVSLHAQSGSRPAPDYVGVLARVRYSGVAGAIPAGGLTIDRRAVYSLEPCAFGLPGC